jgi:hypothetical protein
MPMTGVECEEEGVRTVYYFLITLTVAAVACCWALGDI